MPDGERLPPHLDDLRRNLLADIRLLHLGIASEDGITHPALNALRGHAGLDELEALRDRLAARIAELEAAAALTWPRSFRYTGPRYSAQLDGQWLRPGDVVMLTEHQATAWADRFE